MHDSLEPDGPRAVSDPSAGPPKRTLGDLAILGGTSLFTEPLHVGRPNIGDRARFFERLGAALDRRWLSNAGPLSLELEERIRGITGARHALAVDNATAGIQVAAVAAGLQGDVIVPAFTFVGTAHALRWIGLRPVFCDVDPETLLIDPASAEAAITDRTTGILGVHLWGRVCPTGALDRLAAERGLTVLYDAAHALACTADGRPVGTFGAAEIFSFHATKFVNSFEGGAITTDDDAFADRAAKLRNFGFVGYDRTESAGTNAKMNEAAAAMGLTSLDAMPDIIATNRAHADHYARALAGLDGVRFLSFDPPDSSNAQYAVIRIDAARAGIHRDTVYRALHAENVLARRYFAPGVHRMEPYLGERPGPPLPVTERASDEVLTLPTGTGVTPDDVEAVAGLLRFVLLHGPEIQARLDPLVRG